jgi:hypothetical protein
MKVSPSPSLGYQHKVAALAIEGMAVNEAHAGTGR